MSSTAKTVSRRRKGDAAEFTRHALAALALKPGDDLRRAARDDCGATRLGPGGRSNWNPGWARSPAPDAAAPKPVQHMASAPKLDCRTVFLSDMHLGTPDSKADEVVDFLKHIRCEKLVLNGDIIDGWALKRGARWTSRHSRVIRKIIKMTERDKTEVIYLRGNHDEILERFMPLAFGRIRLVKEHIHTRAGRETLSRRAWRRFRQRLDPPQVARPVRRGRLRFPAAA